MSHQTATNTSSPRLLLNPLPHPAPRSSQATLQRSPKTKQPSSPSSFEIIQHPPRSIAKGIRPRTVNLYRYCTSKTNRVPFPPKHEERSINPLRLLHKKQQRSHIAKGSSKQPQPLHPLLSPAIKRKLNQQRREEKSSFANVSPSGSRL